MHVRALAPVLLVILLLALLPARAAQAATLYDQDFDGDGAPDVVATGANARLYLFPGTGDGAWRRSKIPLGYGWTHLDQVHLAGDWNGDGTVDIVGRQVVTNQLLLYPGDGRGGLLPSRTIGSGWNEFTDILFPGDWSGDGEEDALAIRRSDGALVLYPGNGAGGWLAPEVVGSSWYTRDLVTAVGDWDGDAEPDLLARDRANGNLWLYQGDGRGGFRGFRVIASGWDSVTGIMGPGDWDGDGANDVLVRDSRGRLLLYRGDGAGGFTGRPHAVGSGWAELRLNERSWVPERVIRYTAGGTGGIESDAGAFARHADWTLNDYRGWSLGHAVRFEQVPSGGEFELLLAPASEVAAVGEWCTGTPTCTAANRVFVADEAWRQRPATYDQRSRDDYRRHVVNHGVGHWFGLPDAECPGLRRTAPVMLEQTSSLDLCNANPWPLEEEKEAVRERTLG